LDLTDNKTFQIIFVSCLIVAIVGVFTVRAILKNKGVNVDSRKNMLKMGIAGLSIASLPIWLHPSLSIYFKITIFIVSIAFGIANFFAVDRLGKTFRKYFGIETEEDRSEKEIKEKKKEKEIEEKHV
jgi:hypothetical protein